MSLYFLLSGETTHNTFKLLLNLVSNDAKKPVTLTKAHKATRARIVSGDKSGMSVLLHNVAFETFNRIFGYRIGCC